MGTVIYTQKGSESVATLKTNYLTDLCLIYRESQFYVLQIPSFYKKMASKYFQFQPQEKIIAYLHSSFIAGLDKRGICFTNKGIYWKSRGMKKGKMLWEEFANIQSITIRKEEMICFNDVEKFQVNQNDYSARKLVSLLKKIKKFIRTHSHEYMCQDYIYPCVSSKELTSICSSFQIHQTPDPKDVLSVEGQLCEEVEKEMRNRLYLPAKEKIVAHLNTYPLQKTEGITVCSKGIYFSKSFKTVYYPWHLFRHVSISVETEELKIAKKHSLSLNSAAVSSGEVMLFLKQIKQHVQALHEKEVDIKQDNKFAWKMLI
ncbi:hypothetical protein RKD56_003517 [Priestia megaterium]|jgi:hypothetical protein|nr:hypothetical protein DEU44_2367 [Priestia megaterium]